MLDFLIRLTVFLVGAFLAARALQGRSAAMRAGYWRATFAGIACLAAAHAFLPRIGWLPAPESTGVPTVVVAAAEPAPTGAGVAPVPTVVLPARPRAHHLPGGESGTAALATAAVPTPSAGELLTAATAIAWAIGALLGVLSLGRGLRRARGVARRAAGGGDWCSSKETAVPFVWHVLPWRTARIVLPDSVDPHTAWGQSVLAHERAHVRRRDGFVLPLAHLVSALLWFHPLVAAALRRLHLETERACDDAVLRSGARPSDYARGLVEFAGSLSPHTAVPAMARAGLLEDRVSSVLEPRVDRSRGSWAAAALLSSAVILCACSTATLDRAEPTAESPAEPPVAARVDSAADSPAEPLGDLGQAPSASADAAAVRFAPDRESALRAGVAALLAAQDPDSGGWRGNVGFKLNNGWRVTNADALHVGVTGLAVEALLAVGIEPGGDGAGLALQAGVDFLVDHQDPDGFITANGTRLREHAHALAALASLPHPADPVVVDAVREGLQLVVESAEETGGGWRFQPLAADADIVETGHVLDACRRARAWLIAGGAAQGEELIAASQAAIDASAAFARGLLMEPNAANDRRGFSHFFRYMPGPSRMTMRTSAAGLDAVHRVLAADGTLGPVLRRLGDERASAPAMSTPPDRHFIVIDTEHLASRPMAAVAGSQPAASAWRERSLEWILDGQLRGGGWRCSEGPGDAYATAVACLILAR